MGGNLNLVLFNVVAFICHGIQYSVSGSAHSVIGDDETETQSIPSTPKNGSPEAAESTNSIHSKPRKLLPGEEIITEQDDVGYEASKRVFLKGKVIVTNYRLRFEQHKSQPNNFVPKQDCSFDLTLGSISQIYKFGYVIQQKWKQDRENYGLKIVCKDLRIVKLVIEYGEYKRSALLDKLKEYAFIKTSGQAAFATMYKEKLDKTFKEDGWQLFETKKEFLRQVKKMEKSSNLMWTVSEINNNPKYKFVETYPSLLVIPTEVANDEEKLNRVRNFRSKGRIPILSWIDYRTQATLVRSAQPLSGADYGNLKSVFSERKVTSKKSPDDEEYVQSIINANPNSTDKHLVVLDARPLNYANMHWVKGGGYECDYKKCSLKFLDIDNMYEQRKSMDKLKTVCDLKADANIQYTNELDNSFWLKHITKILEGARKAVDAIAKDKNSVLVHCTDGWDRTAQVASVAMLQLDPFYRTIEGFAILIEKEWCSFGHQFALRTGHGESVITNRKQSPIFVQFIDCVWQLVRKFPHAFEFKENLLVTILDELYASRFGTFLYNSEKKRQEMSAKTTTISLWSYILDNAERFKNPGYNDKIRVAEFTRYPVSSVSVQLWADYYCRHSDQYCRAT